MMLDRQTTTDAPVGLDRAPLHTPLVLASCRLGEAAVQRLRTLGIRPGVRVTVEQRVAGGGRIVSVAGTRVALGRPVLTGLAGYVAA